MLFILAAFLKFAAFFILLPFYNYVFAANLHAAFLHSHQNKQQKEKFQEKMEENSLNCLKL